MSSFLSTVQRKRNYSISELTVASSRARVIVHCAGLDGIWHCKSLVCLFRVSRCPAPFNISHTRGRGSRQRAHWLVERTRSGHTDNRTGNTFFFHCGYFPLPCDNALLGYVGCHRGNCAAVCVGEASIPAVFGTCGIRYRECLLSQIKAMELNKNNC